MYFIGVDPGKSGGVAVLNYDPNTALSTVEWLRKMPDTNQEVWELFDDLPVGQAMLELVHSRPDQSVVAMFTFGENYGFLQGCLAAAEIPYEKVSPQKWQRGLGITPKQGHEDKPEFKRRLKDKAQCLFPGLNITLYTADALLIAEYCRRSHVKER